MYRQLLALTMLSLMATVSVEAANLVMLSASKDNTLYETDADDGMTINERSNGAGDYLFAGRVGFDGGWALRRALLAFDIAAAIPAGSVVTFVELRLYLSKVPISGSSPPIGLSLHRLTTDWGESTSNVPGGSEGQGAPPASDDATWYQRFYQRLPAETWSSPGAGADEDYLAAVSSSTAVGTILGVYTWPCTSALIADVQTWLDAPSANDGWILLGDAGGFSARRFNSRENEQIPGLAGQPPELVIGYQTAGTLLWDTFEAELICTN